MKSVFDANLLSEIDKASFIHEENVVPLGKGMENKIEYVWLGHNTESVLEWLQHVLYKNLAFFMITSINSF